MFVYLCTIYEKKGWEKRKKKEKFDRWKTERDAFRKISLLSRANISSPVTDVERTRDVQCIRSMTHFAREVTRTVPKLDLIDRLYYLVLSTAFCSWNLNHAKIRGSAPSSVRYYNHLNLQRTQKIQANTRKLITESSFVGLERATIRKITCYLK